VERLIGAAVGPDPARVGVPVLARVPAVGGHVDAAAEGQGVVDDYDLLVVAGAGRMVGVEAEVDPLAPHQLQHQERHHLAGHRRQQRGVPLQDVDPQLWPFGRHRLQELAQFVRRLFPLAVRLQLDVQVELPADQHHRVPRLADRGLGRGEVARGVDDQRQPVGALDAPAVPAMPQDGRLLGVHAQLKGAPPRHGSAGGLKSGRGAEAPLREYR
jgi:hypothetical protein